MYHSKLNHSRYARLANSRIPPNPVWLRNMPDCFNPEFNPRKAYNLSKRLSVVYSPFPFRRALLHADRPAYRSFPYYTSCLTPSTQTDSFKRVFSRLTNGIQRVLNQDRIANPCSPEVEGWGSSLTAWINTGAGEDHVARRRRSPFGVVPLYEISPAHRLPVEQTSPSTDSSDHPIYIQIRPKK